MRFRIIVCCLIFISSKWTAQGQFMMCTTDDQCRAFGTPTCGFGGMCDTPSSHTDCDYLGAGTGKKIEIDFTLFAQELAQLIVIAHTFRLRKCTKLIVLFQITTHVLNAKILQIVRP